MKRAAIISLMIVLLVGLLAGAYPSVSAWRLKAVDDDGNALFVVEGGTNAGKIHLVGSATIDNTTASTLTIAETNIVLTGAVDISSGTVDRAALTEDALAVYGIPISLFRQEDGIPLAATETADTFCLNYAANVWLIYGEESLSETETSEGSFQFVLPPEYVSGGDVKVRIKHTVTGTGTLGATATIDVEAFEQDGNGAIGSDLVTTTAATTTDASWTTTDFVVTPTNLVAGDILNIVVTSAIQETAGTAIRINLDGIAVLLDIKG
jgi:hypothetical protein